MLLQVSGLSKKYGINTILDTIDFHIEIGEKVALLGPNGSGKSTILSIIGGMSSYDSGEILFENQYISKKIRRNIGYIPQVPNLLEDLSVKDNLDIWKLAYEIPHDVQLNTLIPDFLSLENLYSIRVNQLSGGQKKKVSIAIALMNCPKLLILDEAFAALDKETCDGFIKYLSEKKLLSCLYTSHISSEIDLICNRAIEISNKKIVNL